MIEVPFGIAQSVSPFPRIIFQRGMIVRNELPDIPGDCAGAACKRLSFHPFVAAQFFSELLGVRIIVFFDFRNKFQFAEPYFTFFFHGALHSVRVKNSC